jgi:adenosylcobinamide kinase/adenosylcobinamide-phosphate guanylyltransferase
MSLALPVRGNFSLLLLGGARSGKSALGERLVAESGRRRIYVATAQAFDGEMEERIGHHRARRGDDWLTIEEPLDLPRILRERAGADDAVLVDCLTLWLTNIMAKERDIDASVSELISAVAASHAAIVLISNEVGWGIVPNNALARHFRDEAGRMHQRLAERLDAVAAVMAGLPLMLKSPVSQD